MLKIFTGGTCDTTAPTVVTSANPARHAQRITSVANLGLAAIDARSAWLTLYGGAGRGNPIIAKQKGARIWGGIRAVQEITIQIVSVGCSDFHTGPLPRRFNQSESRPMDGSGERVNPTKILRIDKKQRKPPALADLASLSGVVWLKCICMKAASRSRQTVPPSCLFTIGTPHP